MAKGHHRGHRDHHLNKLGSVRVPNVVYRISMTSTIRFRRRRFLNIFTIYGHGGHLGHVTTIPIDFGPLDSWRLHMQFTFIWTSGFGADPILNFNKIWVALVKGQGMTLTLGTCMSSCTHLIYYTYQLLPHRLQYFLRYHLKIKDQPGVIIWINLVVLECPVSMTLTF